MSYFDDIIGKLFPKKSKGLPSVEIEEILVRKDAEKKAYKVWLKESKKEVFHSIARAYEEKKAGLNPGINLHIYNSPYANGIFFTYNETIGVESFQHLFDYFKEKVLEMGYIVYVSDRRIIEKINHVETIEKHYLKPPVNSNAALSDQLYGNILIEQVLINDFPSYIKVMANVYSDSKYTKAIGFDTFMEKLFQPI